MPKDVATAYLLWCLGGYCGCHRCYVGDVCCGVAYAFTGAFCGIGCLVDCCCMSSLVDKANSVNITNNSTTTVILTESPGGGYSRMEAPQQQYMGQQHQQQQHGFAMTPQYAMPTAQYAQPQPQQQCAQAYMAPQGDMGGQQYAPAPRMPGQLRSSGAKDFLQGLSRACFNVLRKRGAVSLQGDVLPAAPVMLSAEEEEQFSIKELAKLVELGVIVDAAGAAPSEYGQ